MWKIQPRFWLVFILFFVTIIGWFITGDEILLRLWVFAGTLAMIGLLWGMNSVRGITLHRVARVSRQKVGEFFEEYFEVKNHQKQWRFGLEIIDHSELGENIGSRVLASLGPKQMRSYNTFKLLTKRGNYALGPTTIRSGDPLGFTTAKLEIKNEANLLVLPYYVDLDYFPNPSGLLLGGKTLRKPTSEATPHAASVREYTPGDPLSRIHWPSTVRKEHLMVKEFDRDPQSTVCIFLDAHKDQHQKMTSQDVIDETKITWMTRSKYQYQLPRDSFEYAASIAASIANFYIKHACAAGFSCFGNTHNFIPAEKGARQLVKILEAITYAQPEGDLPIQALVQEEIKNLSWGTTTVVITTSGHADLEIIADTIQLRGLNPIFVLININSFGGRRNYAQIRHKLNARRVPVISISYGDPLKPALESMNITTRQFDVI